MACVFLSYDREDTVRARTIALALEKAGHSVWWDQIIKAGAQYGNEIEQALKDSDAVVVLWSERSIDSAWVRDEAAAGRDSGRLVPVTLDSCAPPLGFRQYQTLDLSSGKSKKLNELLHAIASIAGEAPTGTAAKEDQDQQQSARQYSICVLPFVNMSGDFEQEYFSDGISEDIITDLSKVSALSVVARNTAFTFKGKPVRVPDVARELNVTHVLEGSVRKSGELVGGSDIMMEMYQAGELQELIKN